MSAAAAGKSRRGRRRAIASRRQASSREAPGSGVGLALAGGGPLGGIYEVGALLALADSLDGIDFNDLDVYVGVSSGGFVAAALANGISPAQMYRLFIDDGVDADADAAALPAPGVRRVLPACCASLPALRCARCCATCATRSTRGLMESLVTLSRAMPTGMFDNAVDRQLPLPSAVRAGPHQRLPQARPQAVPGRHEPRHRRVGVFGAPGHEHVPISQGDRGVLGAARPVPAGGDRRRALRRRRAQQDAARLRRARRRASSSCSA